jgi:cyclase
MNDHGRIIPCLTIDGNRLVKTKKFKNYKYLGDPINAVSIFNNFHVDELIILDITRDSKDLDSKLMIARQIANQALMSISYGGGISSQSMIVDLFKMGFDKIILKSFMINTEIVKKLVSVYGSQAFSVCAEVQVRKDQYLINGTLMSLKQVIELVSGYIHLGMGEIFLNYRDLDGTRLGLPTDNLVAHLIKSFKVPVIVGGGASTKNEVEAYVKDNSLVSVAASSIFTLYGKNDAVILHY